MAQSELEQLLSNCTEPEKGCFASDPEALQAMTHFDDSVIRADLMSAAAAAEAGIAGIPFEDVTYTPARLEILSMETGVNLAGEEVEWANAGIGLEDTPQKIKEPDEGASDIDKLRYRVAKCAH